MRNMLGQVAKALALLIALVPYLLHRIESLALGRKRSFMGMSQLLSLVPGVYGSYLRAAFYRLALERCPQECVIEFMTTFVTPEATIGRNVYLGSHCNIGFADIGEDCLFGSYVLVTSGRNQHRFTAVDIPIRLQGGEATRIVIGRDCWIGNGSIIMAHVGDGCVVAAGSVVTEALEPYSIAAGVPARVIGQRGGAQAGSGTKTGSVGQPGHGAQAGSGVLAGFGGRAASVGQAVDGKQPGSGGQAGDCAQAGDNEQAGDGAQVKARAQCNASGRCGSAGSEGPCSRM